MTTVTRGVLAGVIAVGVAGLFAGCSDTSTDPPTPVAASSGTIVGATSGAAATETNPAGDIPDNQAFVDFRPTDGGYSVVIPEGWARTEGAAGTVFTDKYNTITVNAGADPSAPTVESVQASEVPQIQAASTGYQPGSVSTVQRTAGTAVLITYRADSPPSPVTGKVAALEVEQYEFWRAGTRVMLTLSAPVGSDNVDPWRTVTDSFRWSP